MRILFASAVLIFSLRAFGGGSSGGTPPALELPESGMLRLQQGALNGDLIRVSQPGHHDMYLRPDIASIKPRQLAAVHLPSGNATTFYSLSEAEKVQNTVGRNIERSIKASLPGLLPVMQDDLMQAVNPKIEIVPFDEVDQ